AHAVIVVDAYFSALGELNLQVNLKRMKLTKIDELSLAGASREAIQSRKLVEALLATPLPRPTSYKPYEQTVSDIEKLYSSISERLVGFVRGFAVWDTLNETRQSRLHKVLRDDLPAQAVVKYEDNFRNLAAESKEFLIWMSFTDSAAVRERVSEIQEKLETG